MCALLDVGGMRDMVGGVSTGTGHSGHTGNSVCRHREGEELVGAALVNRERVVHLQAFVGAESGVAE